MTQPTLYILDDHPVVAEGLAQLLATEKKYCITTGHHYSELYQYITHTIPDLLILDYELHDKTALDVLAYLRKKEIHIPVIVYTMHTEFWIIKLLIKGEVSGIVIKSDKTEEMSKAVSSILEEQKKFYSSSALNVVLSILGDHSAADSVSYTPSPRENEIINMLSRGLTSDEIAQELNLSKNTIDTMRKNILLKSGAINVSHLMRMAFIKGWITV
ncbi:response regulator transcription factor [Phocaeicola acetigenes]|jgi:DNA-binding NarL/FixJ family response regulator|uniref:Response regulator transcription factor n=1 Tax=Phocaeicola acetigenes TaxID=3016083 RepID=A0ABT4PH78_9BACT|nr:response regulator transcription factor [Phocaeicola sp. KGMB11183]MCZ8372407.1 response regulator transcription factor [Phocaeicola sp. KGMB11183]